MKKTLLFLLMALTLSSCVGNRNNGTLCLTFDDRYFDSWVKAIPLFAEHDARVTFFVYGNVDEEALAAMKQLQDAGHTIGLHSVNHTKAADCYNSRGDGVYTREEVLPQLRVCRENGIHIRAFAYPNSQRSPDTDRELFRLFDFLRTNCSAVKAKGQELAEADGCFVKPVEEKQLFYGYPASGDFNLGEVKKALKRASEDGAVLVFYAHNIVGEIPPSHHIAVSQLKEILDYAGSLGMAVRGMNEL